MKKQTKTTKAKETKVARDFSCEAPDAQNVYLAGTFNDWDPTLIPLKKQKTGIWTTSLDLAPGRYEYKFIVDGEWCCLPNCSDDHDCPTGVTNEHGTMNKVLEIS